ncbi:MAG TPA: FtsW/RodA/SpoVE family cell cycle protein [Thermoanaerobaculia bacterium]
MIIGIVAMRQLGVSTVAWSINIAATAVGLLIWALGRRLPPPARGGTRAFLAVASLATILLPFASDGMLGVYRWISLGGFRLHASAIAAPLIILCVAAAASQSTGRALAIAATGALILALQPDAAQATSFAAACAVLLVLARPRQMGKVVLSVVVLLAVSAAAFIRHDPLPPVAHVEEIFEVVASRGVGWAAMATVALLLLPLPFFAAWRRHRHSTALALGVYVAMTVLAPAWGTFPVPVMGAGASPILGYFIALAAGIGEQQKRKEDRIAPVLPGRA